MVGINKWWVNKWLDLVDVYRVLFFLPRGSGKHLLCFVLCVCVCVCVCVCICKTLCALVRYPSAGELALVAGSAGILSCLIWGLSWVTHIQWQIHAWPSQFNWGQFWGISSSLGLSLWGSLSLGCLTAQLFSPLSSLPFPWHRLQEHSFTSLLQANLHPGGCLPRSPTFSVLFCF